MPFHFCADEARMLLLALPAVIAGLRFCRQRVKAIWTIINRYWQWTGAQYRKRV
jgi:hypothetical protein